MNSDRFLNETCHRVTVRMSQSGDGTVTYLNCANRPGTAVRRQTGLERKDLLPMKLPSLIAALLSAALAPALFAQNRLVNPGFNGNLAGWTFVSNAEQSVDYDTRDANGSTASGSVRQRFLAPSIPNRRLSNIGQPFRIVPGQTYVFGGKYRNDNGQATGATRPPGIALWWLDANRELLPNQLSSRVEADGTLAEGVWLSVTGSGVAPANAVFGTVLPYIPSQTGFQTLFDDVFATGPAPDPCASVALNDIAFEFRGQQTNCSSGTLTCVSGEPIEFIPELIFGGDRSCLDTVTRLSTFRWNFGDGTTSDQQAPVKTFNGPGPFSVQLTVTHPSGQKQASQVFEFAPLVVVTDFPESLVGSASGGATDSYTLRNIGGSPTTINLSKDGTFFTQSPESFTLAPGASQVVTVTALAVSTPLNRGSSIPSGPGVPSGASIPIVVLGIPAPEGRVVGNAVNRRLDIRSTSGTAPVEGSVTFTNSGSATLTGVLAADVPWIIPDGQLVTIPPGGTGTARFAIDGRLRPDNGGLGTAIARVLLVYRLGTSQLGKLGDDGPSSNHGSASAAAAVVHTVTPGTAAGAAPPLDAGEVAIFMPGVAHVLGSVGTFISDVTLTNLLKAGTLANLRMHFKPAGGGASNSTPPINLTANRPLTFGDIALTVFGNSTAVGSLQVRGAGAGSLSASANVFNSSNPAGTYGTTIPSFRSDRSTGANEKIFLPGLTSSPTTHTNLYVQEAAGLPASARIEFFNPTGVLIGSRTEAVAPFGLLPLNTVVPAGAVSAIVTTTDASTGRLLAYATPVDRASGDTWAVVDWPKQYGYDPATPVLIPVAGALRGAGDTYFRTDAAILNSGTTAGSGTMRFVSRTGAVIDRNINLAASQSMVINDVLVNLFNVTTDDAGYITFTPTSGAFAITSRTYTTVSGQVATFGTGVPTLSLASGIRLGETRRFGGINDAALATIQARQPGTFRTNAGLVETTGQPVTVRATLRFTSGAQNAAAQGIASANFDLGPGQFLQINGVSQAIIGASTRNTLGDLFNMQLDFEVISGQGAVVVYTSTLDNGTGDSILRTD